MAYGKLNRAIRLAVFGSLMGCVGTVSAGLINFETVPGGSPSDKLAINTQYLASDGVTFSLSNGGDPHLERTGGADTGDGFINTDFGADAADTGFASQLGNFYLRIGTGGLATTPVPQLIISYSAPVSAAAAQIWDIDGHSNGTEQWLIEALDNSNAVIDSVLSPLGTGSGAASLDGKPWTWSFSHGSSDIYGIRLSFTGSKTTGIGLAFDNFSTDTALSVPEPGTLALMAAGLLGMGVASRRRRK